MEIMENRIGPKIPSVLGTVSRHLNLQHIPCALIGALALGLYGRPRYTSDIDLMADGNDWPAIFHTLTQLGFECFQKTDAFAQFDAEKGILGRVDLMLVGTAEGRDMLKRRAMVDDELLGRQHVIQPTDYLALKMMAIANDGRRRIADEADIESVVKLWRAGLIPEPLEALDMERLAEFADRFGMRDLMGKYLDESHE
jgi:hypothetical protein